jgi:hypothetical protein
VLLNERIVDFTSFLSIALGKADFFSLFCTIKKIIISAGFSDVWLHKKNLRLSISAAPEFP